MTDGRSDEDLASLVAELTGTLEELESELEPPDPEDRPLLPTPRDIRRFTAEVAIPGLILVLETNIRALKLLKRALELRERRDEVGERGEELADRAVEASETTLSRLDDALGELQTALEGRSDDGDASDLLQEARSLHEEVQTRIEQSRERRSSHGTDRTNQDGATESKESTSGGGGATTSSSEPVEIDVDAELDSIKQDLGKATDGDENGGEAVDDDGDGPSDSAEENDDDAE